MTADDAEEANIAEITMAGQALDAVAPAVENGIEAVLGVADGHPAAGPGVEVAGVMIAAVQGDAAVAGAAPGAAVTIPVKVEIGHQLIAEAAT